ncbi:MAG: hypothetical protein QF819_06755 [Gemmatimonadota bacterium]|jgi:hypothetical protein|nr:hypothetical protein [Gemmatimonadota bacterium]MDP6460290.1 hypothetical protein [Gemmatimonadota bacterium]MDP6529170.1 hypothetical protein [Gemmatimonadota bacterium]MDP6802859.1 hypothetical protein [Gemmatimonadota bacterium]MDP7032195.1 hypothetical protein [Gemmatimonadota bacterium]
MPDLHIIQRWLHTSFGCAGLVAFWVAAFSAKGGRRHLAAGSFFRICAEIIGWVAVATCAWQVTDPAGYQTARLGAEGAAAEAAATRTLGLLLGFLAMVLLATIRHGVVAARAKSGAQQPPSLVAPALRIAAAAAGVAAFIRGIGLITGPGVALLVLPPAGLALLARQFVTERSGALGLRWQREHITAMAAAGVVFHTAFLGIGTPLFVSGVPDGIWSAVPWLVPTAVAIPWVLLAARRYSPAGAPTPPSPPVS